MLKSGRAAGSAPMGAGDAQHCNVTLMLASVIMGCVCAQSGFPSPSKQTRVHKCTYVGACMVPTVADIAAIHLTQKSTDHYDTVQYLASCECTVARSDWLGACSLQPGCLRCKSNVTCTAVNNLNAYALIQGRVVPNAGFTRGPFNTAVRCAVRPASAICILQAPH